MRNSIKVGDLVYYDECDRILAKVIKSFRYDNTSIRYTLRFREAEFMKVFNSVMLPRSDWVIHTNSYIVALGHMEQLIIVSDPNFEEFPHWGEHEKKV